MSGFVLTSTCCSSGWTMFYARVSRGLLWPPEIRLCGTEGNAQHFRNQRACTNRSTPVTAHAYSAVPGPDLAQTICFLRRPKRSHKALFLFHSKWHGIAGRTAVSCRHTATGERNRCSPEDVGIDEILPISGGEVLTLLFPQWTPGDHTANGPLEKLAGLIITANGERLRWVRDAVSVYAFHIQVPAQALAFNVSFEDLRSTGAGTRPVLITRTMLDLQWQSALLYPAGSYAQDNHLDLAFPLGMQIGTGEKIVAVHLEGPAF